MADTKISALIVYEPFGELKKEEKAACSSRIILRKINGVWLPEFQTSDFFTILDLNRAEKAFRTGFRQYLRNQNILVQQRRIDQQKEQKLVAERQAKLKIAEATKSTSQPAATT